MTSLTNNSFLCVYFNSLHVSSKLVLIMRISCINTTSGICHSVSVTVSCAGRKGTLSLPTFHHNEKQLYQYNIWCMSLCVGDRFVCRSERNLPTCTRNGHRHRAKYVYQMLYWYNWFSWWWVRGCSKHVEKWNKCIEKNCASIWSFTKNHNEMHGQQNIKFCLSRVLKSVRLVSLSHPSSMACILVNSELDIRNV